MSDELNTEIEEVWLTDWKSELDPEPQKEEDIEFEIDEDGAAVLAMSMYDNIGESATADTIMEYLRNKPISRNLFMTVLHNSATPASADKGLGTVKSFASYHMLNRGWKAIGYHFVIDTKGVIWAGRKMSVVGSHAGSNGNPGSIGVCLVGNFETGDVPTEKQKEALAKLHIGLAGLFYGNLKSRIRFHREFMNTGCPGKITQDQVMGWVAKYANPQSVVTGGPVFHLDGKIIGIGTIINDSAYAPLRQIFEASGFKVDWDAGKFVANLTSPGKSATSPGIAKGTILKPKIYLDGKFIATGALLSGITFAPVRAIFEASGFNVEWKSGDVYLSRE